MSDDRIRSSARGYPITLWRSAKDTIQVRQELRTTTPDIRTLVCLFPVDYLTTAVISAIRTGPVQKLHVAAVRALHRRGCTQASVIVRSARTGTRLRVFPFGVCHDVTVLRNNSLLNHQNVHFIQTAPSAHAALPISGRSMNLTVRRTRWVLRPPRLQAQSS